MSNDIQALSREFSRLTGKVWYTENHDKDCDCGICDFCNGNSNPDYSDAREILRAMREIGIYESFLAYVFDSEYPPDIHLVMLSGSTLLKFISLVIDKTGLMLEKAVEFMEGRKG